MERSACDSNNSGIVDDYNKVDVVDNAILPFLPKRVLSIQSHVVSGYVGNKSAVYPLQLLGFDVDIINSVQFSNHTGYKNGFDGDVLSGEQLQKLFIGLQRNNLLSSNNLGYVLTGYIGSESFLLSVVNIISTLKNQNNNNQQPYSFWQKRHQLSSSSSLLLSNTTLASSNNTIRYTCDPVLGDNGKLYVPISLIELYKSIVLPLADIITPNQYEIELLSGVKDIQTLQDAIHACTILHTIGPKLIFITSLILQDENKDVDKELVPSKPKTLSILASFDVTEKNTTGSSYSCSSNGNDDENDNDNNDGDHDSKNTTKSNVLSKIWQIHCPILPGHYTGTGDVTAALLLAHTALVENELCTSTTTNDDTNSPNNIEDTIIPLVMERVINTMYAMLVRTDQYASVSAVSSSSSLDCLSKQRELRLIQCKDIIEQPPKRFHCIRIR